MMIFYTKIFVVAFQILFAPYAVSKLNEPRVTMSSMQGNTDMHSSPAQENTGMHNSTSQGYTGMHNSTSHGYTGMHNSSAHGYAGMHNSTSRWEFLTAMLFRWPRN
jgi:hypothetical protein